MGLFNLQSPLFKTRARKENLIDGDIKQLADYLNQFPVSVSGATDGQALVYNETNGLWEPGTVGGGSEYTETIVNISSAQILNMGTTPIELLPAPGVGKYYDGYIIFEYNAGSNVYVLSDATISIQDGGGGQNIIKNFITSSINSIAKVYLWSNSLVETLTGAGANYAVSEPFSINSPILLSTDNGGDPSSGDGTLRVKIYHKTITFGA